MPFPPLYKLADNGIVVWNIEVERHVEEHHAGGRLFGTIVTRWGYEGGKVQETRENVVHGKNAGKKNETDPYQQACKEAEAKWTKQQKKLRYVGDRAAAKAGERSDLVVGGYDCMTAFGIEKKPKALKFPCAVQRKYDGHRVLAVIEDGVCTLWSRGRDLITGVPHINRALEKAFPEGKHLVDGEGYTMKLTFQEISSFLRSKVPLPGHEVIEYNIYDAAIEAMSFDLRWKTVQAALAPSVHPLILAPTYIAKDLAEVEKLKEEFLKAGYEGAMARNLNGLYVGKRSTDLLKLKLFEDDEFEVVSITVDKRTVELEDGDGNKTTKTMYYPQFTCKLPGKLSPPGSEGTFNVTLNAKQEQQQECFEHPERFIGKLLTVRYQNYTDDKKLRIPKGLRFYAPL